MNSKELNDEQIEAIKREGNVLLTACPGSGKTRVLIQKLAYKLEKLDPLSKKRVIALTFTIRASEEIFRRLNVMGVSSEKVWSGTLHAFCLNWILKPYSVYHSDLRNGYEIADETYCNNILNDLKDKFNLGYTDTIITRINRDGSFVDKRSIQKKLLHEYHLILKTNKLIDYDLLLYYSFEILAQNSKIQNTLSALFSLICVDEYQDTQDLLYAIISLIIKAGNGKTSLFMVGDVDQAIYTSLGGVAKNLDEIKDELDNMPIDQLTLSGNYRSNQRIIDFYSYFQTKKIKIIAHGNNADGKGIITLNRSVHENNIVDEISRLIRLSLAKGIPENEICVLVPQWWLVTSISKKLRAALPDVNFDASGLAPMSKNRDNIWYKLSRLFLTQPVPKIYSLRYRWVTEIIDLFRSKTKTAFDDNYQSERSLLRLINSIESSKTDGVDYLNDCFDQFIKAVDINILLYPELVGDRELYFESVNKRLNDPTYRVPRDIESFKSFYREMNGVVINTCVGVKGEEFETVISFGLLNGYVPHWNEIFNGDPIDASKKLLYVICSRAKTNLHLICEVGRTTRNGTPLKITPELDAVNFEYDHID